ncbi:MAG: succinylglutamate desuccinylase [Flavobacteriaceae bacterium]|nr:succinylglutamate desuccinylase [Flavobacteriaceae bacterium]
MNNYLAMRSIAITVLFCISHILTAQKNDFVFNDQVFKPGTKTQISIPVHTKTDTTIIPITIFHGKKKGSVLGIVAGVHGLEYAPILAAQEFSKEIDPNQLEGTIILVHMANVPAFLKRSLRVNPMDDKNLNRVFPGSESGSITERIAWTFTSKIIPKCDYYIDVHAGDANNDLRPYAGYYNYFDQPDISEKAKEIAIAMGFPFVIQFGNEQSVKDKSVYTSREAFMQGIPAIDIECGRMGIVEEKFVQRIKIALKNVLFHLDFLKGTPQQTLNDPYIVAQRTTVESEHTGFFYSDFTSGDYVKKGLKLGYITDLFGNHISDVFSPVDGIILYKIFNPPVEKGTGLFNIGHIN